MNNGTSAECDSKKKREDLTSLGSDDSGKRIHSFARPEKSLMHAKFITGIICGSEPDQASLNRIRRSHESIDSGEIDAEGEECIEILDTTSMDEDYRMLQSDLLCFYQSSEDDTVREMRRTTAAAGQRIYSVAPASIAAVDTKMTTSTKSDAIANQSDVDKIRHRQRDQKLLTSATICVPINYEDDDDGGIGNSILAITTDTETLTSGSEATTKTDKTTTTTTKSNTSAALVVVELSSIKPTASLPEAPAAAAHIKNEVIFKTIFGATKNAIYRTAQSIIENHEKKNLAKSNRAIEAAAAAATALAVSTPQNASETAANSGNNAASAATTPTTASGGDVVPPIKSPTTEFSIKKKDFFTLKPCSGKNKVSAASAPDTPAAHSPTATERNAFNIDLNSGSSNTIVAAPAARCTVVAKSLSAFSLSGLRGNTNSSAATVPEKGRVPGGVVKCIRKPTVTTETSAAAANGADKSSSSNGLLRFFESPVFNIHFALHYLFYSKEPGVLSFIGNKIFSFKDADVDLYIPQLILMYMQMDELAEVLDPYLVYRCRRSVDFSLKCHWLLEAYNFTAEAAIQQAAAAAAAAAASDANARSTGSAATTTSTTGSKFYLALMRELDPRRELRRRELRTSESFRQPGGPASRMLSPVKKTHHRSQSDATGLLTVPGGSGGASAFGMRAYQTPVRLCLGDLSTGRAFDNGCTCFETVRGAVNGLLGHKTVCTCGVSVIVFVNKRILYFKLLIHSFQY